jgi:hypothetical protein
MKPFVARIRGRGVLVIAASGSVLTIVEEGGRIQTVDVEMVPVTVTLANSDFPLGRDFVEADGAPQFTSSTLVSRGHS